MCGCCKGNLREAQTAARVYSGITVMSANFNYQGRRRGKEKSWREETRAVFTHRALGGVAVCTQVRADRVRCNDGQAARRGKDSGHGNGQAPEHDVGYVDVCKE